MNDQDDFAQSAMKGALIKHWQLFLALKAKGILTDGDLDAQLDEAKKVADALIDDAAILGDS